MLRQWIAVLGALFLGSFEARAYYGRSATEAILSFRAYVDVPLSGNPTVEYLNRSGRKARQLVDGQIQHLMGTFQSVSFVKEFGYQGVLGEQYEVAFRDIRPTGEPGRKRITYDFRGKVVFNKNAFRSDRPVRSVPLKLPLSPDRIYTQVLSKWGMDRGIKRCTDPHYPTEGDFWYFWDPDAPGCPLKGDQQVVLRGSGTLRMLPNTRLTYPEYDRLYGDNGNGDAFDIALFYGYIRDIHQLRSPNRRDEAYQAFRVIEQSLLERGFELSTPVGKRGGFRIYSDGRIVEGINFHRLFQKKIRQNGKEVLVRVQVMLADTDIASRDATFHTLFMPALAQADVVIFDGHSGLGSALDLKQLPPVRMNPAKYQVYFFNGCSSYPYFNGMFFDRKQGSRSLEIVTSGLPTFADTAAPNALAFLDGFLALKTLSYQSILDRLEDSNGEAGTYLTGVSGDEDNRWRR